MNARTLAQHLRRYPWWYALAAAWLAAMVSLPIVQGTSLAGVFGEEPTQTTTTAVVAADEVPDLGSDVSAEPPGSTEVGDDDEQIAGDDAVVPPADEGDEALQLVPPELLDLIFDALPPVVFPALPAEVAPVFNAVAPVAASGCSGLGLAGVVVAVAAQSAEGVPIERLLPYLAPASTACASFPIPSSHTVCEADKPFVTDLGGLAMTPPILGLGIDQLLAFEALLSNTFGQSVPSVADQLAAQLDCHLVK